MVGGFENRSSSKTELLSRLSVKGANLNGKDLEKKKIRKGKRRPKGSLIFLRQFYSRLGLTICAASFWQISPVFT